MADNKYTEASRQRLIACMASREHALRQLDDLVEAIARNRSAQYMNEQYPHDLIVSILNEVRKVRYDLNRYECGDEKTEALAACEVSA
tara:strand:- start:501 stop:764 length:264 start_codon:yes stop_codon:yes gene_type:complete